MRRALTRSLETWRAQAAEQLYAVIQLGGFQNYQAVNSDDAVVGLWTGTEGSGYIEIPEAPAPVE